MILIGLKIKIDGFWASNLSKRFHNADLKVVDIHPVKDGNSRGILEVQGTAKLNNVTGFLKNQKDIQRVDVLLNDADSKLISFYFTHGPLGDIVIESDVHIRPPLILENGFIIVNLIGNEPNIMDFLSRAKRTKNIEIELIKKSNLKYLQKPRLTYLQERLLKAAAELGFYDIPRRINLKGLAKRVKIAPSTLGEHLRKAEGRIIKDYF